MKLLLCGGGTLGPVSPLLAIVDEMRTLRGSRDIYLWVGTKAGPEKIIVENYQIPFVSIESGKLRRYVSMENVFDFFRVWKGIRQAKRILRDFHPDVVLTAGGYVSVPVSRAATKLRIPYFVHQQDVLPGLANRLMAKHAAVITVTFEASLAHFPSGKGVLTGNPVRPEILRGDKTVAKKIFGFSEDIPILLCMGGGTGATWINTAVVGSLSELTKHYQILHITGQAKGVIEQELPQLPPFQRTRYKQVEFLAEDMKHAFALADLVVCRAGASTGAELALLGKAALIIPIPDSHQVANALWFKKNNACFYLDQKQVITPADFVAIIQGIFSRPGDMETVRHNIRSMNKPDAGKRMVKEILERVKE
jgi:UDP-N-acetylglucosamine--N-acetylmuramyl-(pentapeptide) pyrophosphoryl-undecaprenol N-acetylglucosamine transferase